MHEGGETFDDAPDLAGAPAAPLGQMKNLRKIFTLDSLRCCRMSG